VDWAIYAALAVGLFAIAAGLVSLAVRALEAWRAFKRLRRQLGRELERLADLGERTAESAARVLDTSELDASLARLRVTLARFALLREAIDEATGTVWRLAAVDARK
jgi:alkylation response protein AidB-like acyl-CoA dehydrogenase